MEKDFHSNVPNMQKSFLVTFRRKKKKKNVLPKPSVFLFGIGTEVILSCESTIGLGELVFLPRQNKEKFQTPGSCYEMEMSLLEQIRDNC